MLQAHPHPAWLAGASGLVGRELAALWPGPGTLHLMVRRAQAAGAWQAVHVLNFSTLPSTGALPRADEAYCCLGTTIAAAGSEQAFRAVDLGAVMAFARSAQQAGARKLAVVSALGADPESRSFYLRTKGEMEAALATLPIRCIVIARPSLLDGDRASLAQRPRRGERLALALARPLAPLLPERLRPIAAATVARAMLRAVEDDIAGVRVVESDELHELGAE